MSDGIPFLFEERTVGNAIKPTQHRCKQGVRIFKPFNKVQLVFTLGKIAWFRHPGFKHLVKIDSGFCNFKKVCIEELYKRFNGINPDKGFRAEIG